MPTFYDKDGKSYDVAEDTASVKAALAAGMTLRPGTRIGVVSPTGQGGTVPSEKLGDAFAKGFTIESLTDEHERRMDQKYGDAELRTFLERGVNVVSGGLYDAVAKGIANKTGDDSITEGLRERAQRNEIGGTTGSVAFGLAPALITGGGSAATLLKNTPAGLAMEAGAGVRSLAGGSKVFGAALQGATEGGLFAVGQTVSDVSLADHPMTAEEIAATLKTNVIFGAATGGIIGGGGAKVGELATAGAGKLRQALNAAKERVGPGPIGDDMLRAIAKKPTRATDLITAAKADAASLRTTLEAERSSLAAASAEHAPARAAVDAADAEVKAGVQKFRKDFDDLQKYTRQERGILRKVENPSDELLAAHKRLADAQDEVRRLLPFEETKSPVVGKRGAPTARSKTTLSLSATDDELVTLAREKPELFQAIEDQRSAFMDLVQTRNPATKLRTISDIFSEPANSLESAALRKVSAERTLAEVAAKTDTATLQKIQSQIDDIERSVNMSKAEFDRNAAEKTIKMAEDAGLKIPEDQMLKIANGGGLDITELPPPGSNREVLLKAKAYQQAAKAQLATRAGGRVPGGDSLGLLGAVAGDYLLDGIGGLLLGGLVGKTIGKFARPFLGGGGNVKAQLMAKALAIGTRIADGVDAIVAHGGTAARVGAIVGAQRAVKQADFGGDRKKVQGDDRTVLKEQAANIHALAANPEQMRAQINAALRPVHQADYRLGDKLAVAAENKIAFLASKAPKDPQMGDVSTGFKRWQPSDAAVAKFARYVRAAEDPVTLLDDMKHGKLTTEAVEAVRTLYPEIYSSIQAQLMDKVAALNKSLPYADRLQLSILFEVPVDSTMRGEFVAALQANFAGPDAQQDATSPTGGAPQGAHIPSRAIERMEKPQPTEAQRLSA